MITRNIAVSVAVVVLDVGHVSGAISHIGVRDDGVQNNAGRTGYKFRAPSGSPSGPAVQSVS